MSVLRLAGRRGQVRRLSQRQDDHNKKSEFLQYYSHTGFNKDGRGFVMDNTGTSVALNHY